jgi:hypothetical protein
VTPSCCDTRAIGVCALCSGTAATRTAAACCNAHLRHLYASGRLAASLVAHILSDGCPTLYNLRYFGSQLELALTCCRSSRLADPAPENPGGVDPGLPQTPEDPVERRLQRK